MTTSFLAALAAVWAAINPNDSASWVGGAAALTLLTIAIGFNAGTLVRLRRDVRDAKEDQRRDQRVCNYQLGVLVDVLTANAINVPGNFYDVPDDEILQIHENERRRRRSMFRMSGDPDGEGGWVTSIFIGTVASILAVFLIFALGVKELVLDPVSDLRDNNRIDHCVASLSADWQVSVDLALGASPDSDTRNDYLMLANRAAERIRNRTHICADGKPDPFPLPTIPGVDSPSRGT